MAETILFWIFAAGSVLTALAVVLPPFPRARDPIHSAIALVACFFCVAALYAILSAHLVAVLQVVVYAGAIMVLFIFVIMLLNLQADGEQRTRVSVMKVFAGALALSLGAALVTFIVRPEFLGPLASSLTAPEPAEGYGTLEPIGRLLFDKFLLPFELTSVLLLAAIVGSVIVAKREPATTFSPEGERQRLFRERHGKHAVAPRAPDAAPKAAKAGHGAGHGHEEEGVH